MSWQVYLQNWHTYLDRLEILFPHADRSALERFRGNRHLLAEYIADTHELTFQEGLEAIEERLLCGLLADGVPAQAA